MSESMLMCKRRNASVMCVRVGGSPYFGSGFIVFLDSRVHTIRFEH